MLVLEDCAFHGNVKGLWQELCNDRPAVTFKDVDQDSAKILDRFRKFLVNKYGNLVTAWDQGIDHDGVGRVDKNEFTKAYQTMEIPARNSDALKKSAHALFKLLLEHHGQLSITIRDLEPLLIGIDPVRREAVWCGNGKETDENEGEKEKKMSSTTNNPARDSQEQEEKEGVESSPESPNAQTAASMRRKAKMGAPSPREHIEGMLKIQNDQDFMIDSLESFKKMLIAKYGSLFAAWRKGPNTDNNGLITKNDFSTACRFLGVKAVQQLWDELDKDKNKLISLDEIDPEVGMAFAGLEKCLLDKYGNTKVGWKKEFDKDNSLRCDKKTFLAGCKALAVPGDHERLFKLLKPEPGRPHLAYEDLWINFDPNSTAQEEEKKMSSTTNNPVIPSHGQSPKASTSHGQPPRAGSSHGQSPKASTFDGRSPKASTSHGPSPKASTSHGPSPKASPSPTSK